MSNVDDPLAAQPLNNEDKTNSTTFLQSQQQQQTETSSSASASSSSSSQQQSQPQQQQPVKKNLTGAAMVKQVKEYGVGGFFEKSEDYKHFKEWVPKSTIETSKPNKKTWTYYQYGPRQVTPLIFLHGLSGTADCFFHQILSLSVKVCFTVFIFKLS